MPTSITTNSLKINTLTKAQYDSIQNPSDTELYLIEEEIEKEDVTQIEAKSTAISTLTAEVGKYYRFDVPVETLAITLPTMTGVTSVKTITFYMTGGTTPGVTFTSTHDVHLADGFEVKSGMTYEVNAAWNGLAWIVAGITIIVE